MGKRYPRSRPDPISTCTCRVVWCDSIRSRTIRATRTAFAERIRGSAFAQQAQLHHDDGAPEQKLDAQAAIGKPREDVHLYVCGPTGFMDWVLGTARGLGWPDSHLHREYFAGAATTSADDRAFEVQLASSGAVIRVMPDQTVVTALAAAAVQVPVSCEQGVCGTCLTRVIDGMPDHRDMYLTDEERSRGDQFTPCCSRGQELAAGSGPLTLATSIVSKVRPK